MRKRVIAADSGGRRRKAVRSTAAALALLLIFASVVPSFALAEKDTEGEGTSPPGALPGLEVGVGGELAGEETTLEEVAVEPGEAEVEEVGSDTEAELPEAEPVEPVTSPTSAEAPQPSPEAPAAPVEVPPAPTTAAPPATGGPVYGAGESPPTYEPAQPPAAPAEAVRNETIAAPASPGSQQKVKAKAAHQPSSAEGVDSDSTPTEPTPTPTPTVVVVQAAPAAQPDRGGALIGSRSHVVVGGECLWSIATALLPPGASAAEIAAEVHRLWRLNSTRIGTGDPNMLPIGVDLRLV
jgi:hypothetical protein